MDGSWTNWVGCVTSLAIASGWLIGVHPPILFICLPLLMDIAVAVAFMVRGRVKRSLTGVLPRVTAYGSTFLVGMSMRVSSPWRRAASVPVGGTLWIAVPAALVVLASVVLGFWPLWYLRRSFSIEPAARELVTTGPYAVARHPMYTIYALGYAGLLVLRPTPTLAVLLVGWCALTYFRMGYEERVLMEAFPEYALYRTRVGAFGPRLRWSRSEGAPPEPSGPA
jgi:protein-S-isoprenylcysteine O-methyltransferase Ste14